MSNQALLHVGRELKVKLQYIAAGEPGELKWQDLARQVLTNFVAMKGLPLPNAGEPLPTTSESA